ncbi:peptidoglycan-binding domain-containing protein [Streptomyces sp. NPDC001668]|uniref:peptidoglycan-binding domain-containing protein n=1 Tax=unclassified Streptomyces TaxID=2593676 RepID=UPI0036ADFB3C
MAESSGHLCPECGAPRGADNTPSCGCTERASDALRDARTAEAAAAEDFDPLRIRPYVELDDETAPVPKAPAPDVTMPLRAVPPRPDPTDLSLFEATGTPSAPDETRGDRPRRTRRRTVLLATAGAAVAVVAAAGLASGLFAYEPPSRDRAAPQDVRPAVPDAPTTVPSASPSTATTSLRPSSAPPSAPASASRSASPSPSPSQSSAVPSPSSPSAPPPTPTASGGAADDKASDADAAREAAPPVLRRGSEGPEVVELELRLTQLGLYTRKASGHYNEGVEDAVSRYQWARGVQPTEYGVYDLVTRQRLESETAEP